MIKDEKKRESFVVYSSWLETIENLAAFGIPKETIRELEHNLLYYGFTEKFDTDDKSITTQIESLVAKQLAASTARYAASVSNGTTGGRPSVQLDMNYIHHLKESGLSNAAIARTLKEEMDINVSAETIRRRYNDWLEKNRDIIEATEKIREIFPKNS